MNILNEFNNLFNTIYSYRLPILLFLGLLVAVFLLIIHAFLSLETDVRYVIMGFISIAFIIEISIINNILISNKVQISDIIFVLLEYIFGVIIIECIRFLEFLISKTSEKYMWKYKDGRYSYGIVDLDVKIISDNIYIIKGVEEFVLHCKDGEAECKLVSKEEIMDRIFKINFKIVSKIKYDFFS